MTQTNIHYPHLEFGEDGTPIIARVNFKAIHLIANHIAHGWSAEEMVINFPQLTLGEVYSTLTWFADHYSEVIAHIDQSASTAKGRALEDRHVQMARRLHKNGHLKPSPEAA